MSAEFSLRAICRQVWEDLGGADYHVLAKEVHRRIRAADPRRASPRRPAPRSPVVISTPAHCGPWPRKCSKQLWREARRIHLASAGDHDPFGTYSPPVASGDILPPPITDPEPADMPTAEPT